MIRTDAAAVVTRRFYRRFSPLRAFDLSCIRGAAWTREVPSYESREAMRNGSAPASRIAVRYWKALDVAKGIR